MSSLRDASRRGSTEAESVSPLAVAKVTGGPSQMKSAQTLTAARETRSNGQPGSTNQEDICGLHELLVAVARGDEGRDGDVRNLHKSPTA